ncbi:transferrin-binding protein-like solute binding protein [Haemophilus influenzae]|uniref:Transferrin-binding protein B n=1 Tax=Haemophilus influenzae TaxID=727 RepID=A0AAJ8WDC2_HAEIF|nr:transferrin-binding protein-like solute binding protein [Haemophilus influenzae]KMZ31520.1 transferrin-binding protein 2 [Haemophilus influenzae]MCK8868150.1 transferrin-binding protein-like solute binding protein [Haemophilus influenzae]MCK8875064.1 transferrin-binding protein-like solute binding protein [Haemophilus influenzae]MCK8915129.1 transferrin-binding protein-like solute binding protein [Haemophilus influenzae]MCK8977997.1 transferrin-binding protein-like solute binding protein [H
MKSVPLITGGLSFLLSACSGGGSFDVDNVSNPSSSKPRYQDDTSSSRTKSKLEKLSIPSLGGGMKLVAQNFTGAKEPSFLNEDGYIPYFSSLSTIKEDVEKVKKEKSIHTNPIGRIDEPNEKSKDSNSQKYVYSGLYYIENWRELPKPQEKEKKAYSGYYGYAFYYGNKTATNLPVSGVATYKGTWDFITATKNGQRYSLLSNDLQAYSRRSAIPKDIDLENDSTNGDIGLISEFSADFGTKKLKGELFYTKRKTNNQDYKKEKLYDIEAHIYSNRFRGKVIPKDKDPTSTDHPFTSEGTLEGGFYGPDGEELGGKFLAQDNRVFGVFSAKGTEETPEKKLSRETLIDGKLTTFKTTNTAANTTTDATTNATANTENFTTKDIPSFGEADYLLIDNQPIPLLPENAGDFISSKHHEVGDKTYKVEACCKNLSYVKFGMYYEDKEKKNKNETGQYHQFLLGLRTASSQIPATGNVKYLGSWFGYISDGKTSYSPTGNKQQDKNAVAEFTVDFGNKTLKGQLKHADTQNPVFNIEADFKNSGNAFKGTATATNFVIDGNNSQNGNTQINIKTEVNGAFYGPDASELGGYFTYNGNPTPKNPSAVPSSPNSENARAAVVFGAKKQVETTNK